MALAVSSVNSGWIFATKACVDNRKKNLLSSNISSTCPHNMANFGPLAAEIVSGVWGVWSVCLPAPQQISTGFVSCLRYCSDVAYQRPTKLCTVFGHTPGLLHYIYIFGGTCPLTEFCLVKNSLYIQVLFFSILAALLHGTPAAGISQTLRHGTRNGITELS